MNLNFDMIKQLTFGAEYVAKSDGKTVFSRFTQEERSVLDYGVDNSLATAGVRMEFEMEKQKFGDFFQVAEIIKEIALKCKNVIFINGTNFIPQNKAYFRDSYLHPNDDGFSFYTQSLIKEIEKYF